jgi:transposase-like protein
MGTPTTLQAAVEYFANPQNCHSYAAAMRWPQGVTCPTCGRTDVGYLANQQRWQCREKHAKRQFSVKVGTIMEDSPIELKHWLLAMWMISNCRNGVSSYEVARATGVSQKTAWFMLHRIRLAMQNRDGGKIGGDVEVDESFIGGKGRNMHADKKRRIGMQRGRSMSGKVAVMALLDRHGKNGVSQVRTEVISGRKKGTLQSRVRAHVEEGSNVYTDAFFSYRGLSNGYVHGFIDHAEAYVDGEVHTNGCENFWSLLKRTIGGTYVSVEPFHLFRYLDEQAMRFNERKDDDAGRFEHTVRQIVGRRVTWNQLTGREGTPA